uniref:interleukin-27 subunit beta-like n=1 Tax=Myxine glutinosa TaxID=7769 RepID=UPI00358DDF20
MGVLRGMVDHRDVLGLFISVAAILNTNGVTSRLLFATIDSSVNITCNTTQHENQIVWKRNATLLTTADGVLQDGTFSIKNVSLSHRGSYTCQIGGDGKVLEFTTLTPGYPPGKPIISCRVVCFSKPVQCSWRLTQETFLTTTYNVTYTPNKKTHGGDLPLCRRTMDMTCEIPNSIPLYQVNPERLTVTASNGLGSASNTLPFILEDIVKPDIPVEVVATRNCDNFSLRVTWKPPASWNSTMFLKYIVRFKMLDQLDWNEVTVIQENELNHYISNEFPEITVQVAAQDANEDGEMSSWSVVAKSTTCPFEGKPTDVSVSSCAGFSQFHLQTTPPSTQSKGSQSVTSLCASKFAILNLGILLLV